MIFPNPVKNILYFQSRSNYSIKTIKVFDILGKLVLAENNPTIQLDISSLESGLFFVSITTENGTLIKKIIKK